VIELGGTAGSGKWRLRASGVHRPCRACGETVERPRAVGGGPHGVEALLQDVSNLHVGSGGLARYVVLLAVDIAPAVVPLARLSVAILMQAHVLLVVVVRIGLIWSPVCVDSRSAV